MDSCQPSKTPFGVYSITAGSKKRLIIRCTHIGDTLKILSYEYHCWI